MNTSFTKHLLSFTSAILTLGLGACGLLQKAGSSEDNPIVLDTLNQYFVYADAPIAESTLEFRPTFEQLIDVHHIELDLSFNWAEEEVLGIEKLWVSAYFYPQDTIELDARGFEIKLLTLNGDTVDFEYDGLKLRIPLDSSLGRMDTVMLALNYIARPTRLASSEGRAITSDKGLYFINPRGEDPDKPTQLWTQGEPESNSGWFALVDKPADKFTQEIFLTVDSSYQTLSNGAFIYSSLNADGTKTDYWKQSLPHSGYLAMVAVGEFSIVKDEWNERDVWYYVPKEYEPYARSIFGNTPEMLEFYSQRLKTPYPWEKYHQIVVEDFVSGAMENTSAVIHGSFVARTDRELLDANYEDVVAHELFHHWFGDLVTSESWAQITMNEGFATYGEYLWKEYKYGQEEADLHLHRDLQAYFSEYRSKSVPLIRNYYHSPDDVFDSHSYQKGGRVLHMLRKEVGDEAFFESLRLYLEVNAFKPVEQEMLRLAFEETTGRDMRWFFDQWYTREGHPELSVSYSRDTASNKLLIRIMQDSVEVPFRFHLPFSYAAKSGQTTVENLWVDALDKTYSIAVPTDVQWFGVNADGSLLGVAFEQKPDAIWKQQALIAEEYFARGTALRVLEQRQVEGVEKVLTTFIEDDFWFHRWNALMTVKPFMAKQDSMLMQAVLNATQDKESSVRHAALNLVDTLLGSAGDPLFLQALRDSSFMVQSLALRVLGERNPCSVLAYCDSLEKAEETALNSWLSHIYAQCGDHTKEDFFYAAIERSNGVETMLLNTDLVDYAIRINEPDMIDRVMEQLFASVQQNSTWWMTYSALDGLKKLHDFIDAKVTVLEQHSDLNSIEKERLARWKNKRASISALLDEVRESEDQGRPDVFYRE